MPRPRRRRTLGDSAAATTSAHVTPATIIMASVRDRGIRDSADSAMNHASCSVTRTGSAARAHPLASARSRTASLIPSAARRASWMPIADRYAV